MVQGAANRRIADAARRRPRGDRQMPRPLDLAQAPRASSRADAVSRYLHLRMRRCDRERRRCACVPAAAPACRARGGATAVADLARGARAGGGACGLADALLGEPAATAPVTREECRRAPRAAARRCGPRPATARARGGGALSTSCWSPTRCPSGAVGAVPPAWASASGAWLRLARHHDGRPHRRRVRRAHPLPRLRRAMLARVEGGVWRPWKANAR